MPRPITSLPDVLVLGAGGTLGIAWLQGILGGIGLDFSQCEYFVGTSAGSYVAAHLAAGRDFSAPKEMHDAAAEVPDEVAPGPLARAVSSGGRVAAAVSAPFVPLALRATRKPGELARAAVLRTALGRGTSLGLRLPELGGFDGRLRVTAVDRVAGKRVVFGAPGAPPATVSEAVHASCSVPWIFAPISIGGREYVDGGVWSMSNLDAAPAGRQAEVLAFLPTFGRGTGRGAASVLRAAGQAAGLAELQILRTRGVRTRIIAPDAATIEAMGSDLMSSGPAKAVTAAGRAQGRILGTKS